MSYKGTDLVEVRAWGKQVGAVTRDPNTGFCLFEYSEKWLKSGVSLSPLAMLNSNQIYSFPNLAPETFQRLPAMLADSLPDRFGNALVNRKLLTEGLRPEQITPLDRLVYMGERGMGALTFHPAWSPENEKTTVIALADLVAAAKKTLKGTFADSAMSDDALAQLIQVGTSAGGARAKAVLAYNRTTKQYKSGQLPLEPGYEHWILKLDGVSKDKETGESDLVESADYCRIEYAYFLMARSCGISVSDCELLPEGPRFHFLTKRFDRGDNDQRIHMQSLCAVSQLDFNMSGTHSYAQYFQTIRALGMGSAELAEAFRRMVFNVVACNRDDHTKNFAFLLPEGGTWRLAPAFDLIYAHNMVDGFTVNHQMAVNGKYDKIELSDIRTEANRELIFDSENIITQVLSGVERWPEFAKTAGVSPSSITRIHQDMLANHPGSALPAN